MLFPINPNPTFSVPVSLTVPGQSAPGSVTFTFRARGRKELEDWVKTASGKSDAEFLGEVVTGWDGVADQAGVPMDFTAKAFATLLDAYPASSGEIFSAYMKALTESRAKN
jgi:hypothetical protein